MGSTIEGYGEVTISLKLGKTGKAELSLADIKAEGEITKSLKPGLEILPPGPSSKLTGRGGPDTSMSKTREKLKEFPYAETKPITDGKLKEYIDPKEDWRGKPGKTGSDRGGPDTSMSKTRKKLKEL